MENQKGHRLNVATEPPEWIYRVVVYDAGNVERIPGARPHHVSRTAGVIHLLDVRAYRYILEVFVTPAEVWEYFDYRQALLLSGCRPESEPAIVDMFLADVEPTESAVPDPNLGVATLKREQWNYDLRRLLSVFEERIYHRGLGQEPTDYFKILTEIARLARVDLHAFRERLQLCVETAKADQRDQPYLLRSMQTECGFVFVPCPSSFFSRRVQALENFTAAAKYRLRVERQVGVIVSYESPYIDLTWLYLEGPWAPDPELEAALAENDPFRPLRTREHPRYEFVNR